MQQLVKPQQSESLISLSLLRSRIPSQFQPQFVQDVRLCLDCGGQVTEKDEELACNACGRVWSEEVKVETEGIPFETESVEAGHAEGHWNPPSYLAFNRGMGSNIDGKALFRILAKGPSGNTDLPLRACFIKVLTSKTDHPTISSLLSYGSALCYNYGFKSNHDSDQVFSNQLGRLLRKIGAYYVLRGETGGELRRLASAVFYTVYAPGHPGEAEKVFEELGLSSELLRYAQNLLSFLECPPRKQKRKQN